MFSDFATEADDELAQVQAQASAMQIISTRSAERPLRQKSRSVQFGKYDTLAGRPARAMPARAGNQGRKSMKPHLSAVAAACVLVATPALAHVSRLWISGGREREGVGVRMGFLQFLQPVHFLSHCVQFRFDPVAQAKGNG